MIMKLLLKEQSDLYIEKMVIIIQRKSKKVKTIYKSGTVLKAKSFYVVSCQMVVKINPAKLKGLSQWMSAILKLTGILVLSLTKTIHS